MSKIDYSTFISDPTYCIGNSAEIHEQVKQALIAEADENNTTRNFVLQTSNVPQIISSNVHIDGDFTTGGAFSSAGFDVNGDGTVDFTAEVHFQADTIIQEFIQYGYTDLQTDQSISGVKTFDHIESSFTPVTDTDLTNKLYVDSGLTTLANSKQNNLTAHSVQDGWLSTNIPQLNASSNSFTGNLNVGGVLTADTLQVTNTVTVNQSTTEQTNLTVVQDLTVDGAIKMGSSGTLQLLDNALAISKTSGLQSALDLKANLSQTLYENTYYVNAGVNHFSDVLTAIGSTQSQCVMFSTGGHNEVNNTTAVTINSITLTLTAPDSAFTSSSSVIYYPITISGSTCTRILLSNFNFHKAVTIDGTQGRHNFKACTFGDNFTLLNSTTNWVNFAYCTFSGQVNIPSTFAGYCIFFSCDFTGATLNLNNSSNTQIYFNSCTNLPSMSVNGLLEGFNTTVTSSAINTVSFNCSGTTSFGANSIAQSSVNGLGTALNSKANANNAVFTGTLTLPNSVVADSALASTFVKPSSDFTSGSITLGSGKTISGVSATTMSYVDPSSSIQTQINSKQNTITDGDLTIARTSGLQTALDSKQPTLTTGSVSDLLLASTFVKPLADFTSGSITLGSGKTISGVSATTMSYVDPTSSIQTQINSKQATLSNASYLDVTSSAQTQLNGKQATLTAGSVSDAMLASTFVKPSTDFTSGSITLATGKTISGVSATTMSYVDPTSSIQTQLNGKQNSINSSTSLTVGNLTSTSIVDNGNLAVNGNITLQAGKTLNGISTTTLGYIDPTSSIQTQINSKQATLSNASFLDATSSVQTQLNGKQATLTTNSIVQSNVTNGYCDLSSAQTIAGVKTFSSAPVLSGASITSATVPDSALVSTFVKSGTAPTLTGTNFTSIPTSAISSGALTVTSITCTSETDSGLGVFGGLSEKFYAITTGTNAFTLNYSTGCVFYLSTGSTLSANFSVSLQNLGSTTSQSQTITLIYATTGKYYCNSVTAWTDAGSTQITLSSATPLYLGGTPSISTSTVMAQTFCVTRLFGSNYCISSVASYY